MIIELTEEERYEQERLLPPIFPTRAQQDSGEWPDSFYPDRIDWYTLLVIEAGVIKGEFTVIPEFIAAMIMESGLNNRTFHDANPDPEFGLYWVALDSTGHMPLTRSEIIRFRSDPLVPLMYVASAPDLTTHTPNRTWFNEKRWNAWKPEILDPRPVDGISQWSPLKAAIDAWERVA